MDFIHRSSTTLLNRVQLTEKLLQTYENLSETIKTSYDKELRTCATLYCIHEIESDHGNKSKVHETSNLETNHILSVQPKHLHVASGKPNIFTRSRSITKVLAKRCDREPSRIHIKKFVHLFNEQK